MKNKKVFFYAIIAAYFALSLFSCDTTKLKETPIDNFIGTWELQGREMFDGIKIKIHKTENGEFIGNVLEINNDKYVKMFVDSCDIWVVGIKRSSNFEFKLIEKKIANQLFSSYGLNIENEFKVQFIDENTLGLSAGNSKSTESSIIYKRVSNIE